MVFGLLLVVPAGVMTYGLSTGQTVQWWSASGQWIGGLGALIAALAALEIARRGWAEAERIAADGWDRAEAEHRRQEARYDAERAADVKKAQLDGVARDLDESRRIALTALLMPRRREQAEALASLVNALTFHSRTISPQQGRDMLGALPIGAEQDVIKQRVDELCRELGDPTLFGT